MGQCGPVDPCEQCKPLYDEDESWTPDEDKPGSYRLTTVADRKRRKLERLLTGGKSRRRMPPRALSGQQRLPVASGSRGSARRRRNVKRRRTS